MLTNIRKPVSDHIRYYSYIRTNSYLVALKPTKLAELKQKSTPELQKMLQESRERLRQLRFDLAAGKVKNIRLIKGLKRDIARILTIINE